MKNKILLLIDSLGNFENEDFEKEITPYLYYLKKQSYVYNKMYSQAPYTEAALMAFYTGKPTMSNGGYMLNFKKSKTFIDELNEKGYKIYKNNYPHIYPSSLRRGCTSNIYSTSFDMQALWSYRLSYFSSLYDEGRLNNDDFKIVEELIVDNLNEFKVIYQGILNNTESTLFLRDNSTICIQSIEQSLNILEKEHESFEKDKIAYIRNLFELRYEHPLFQLYNITLNNKIKDPNFKKEFNSKYNSIFKKINIENRRHNKIFNIKSLLNLKSILVSKEYSKKDLLKYGYYTLLEKKYDRDLNQRIEQLDVFKNASCMLKHFDHFFSWINRNEEPYMAILHVDDIHNPEMFFSYDYEDFKILDEEFKLIENVLNKIPKSYKGSITYLLSLAYADLRIQKFIEKLKEMGEFENTEIYITGDHGFSFSYRYDRKTFVTNFDPENYQVPFYILNKFDEKIINRNLCSSLDIYDLITKDEPISSREYVTMEYMGAGCPDFSRRPVLLAIKNNHYFVSTAATYNNDFKDIVIKEIYDVEKDPRQLNNMKSKIDSKKICELVILLENRYSELLIELQGEIEICKIMNC